MNTPNDDSGRLERRVRRVGRETMPGIHGFCSFFTFGAIRGGAASAPDHESLKRLLGFWWQFVNDVQMHLKYKYNIGYLDFFEVEFCKSFNAT